MHAARGGSASRRARSRPSMRDPFTWSARSSMIGSISTGISSGRCCPSASSETTMSAPRLQRDVVAHPQRHAAAAPDRQRRRERAGDARGVGGAVVGVVVDHDRHDVVAGDLLRHRLDHRPTFSASLKAGEIVITFGPAGTRRSASAQSNRSTARDSTSCRIARSLRSAWPCSRNSRRKSTTTATEQQRDEPPVVTRLEVERVEDRVEQVGERREHDDGDRRDAGSEQAEPADVAALVGAQGSQEERDRGRARQQPERPHRSDDVVSATAGSAGCQRSRGRMWSAITRPRCRSISLKTDSISVSESRCGSGRGRAASCARGCSSAPRARTAGCRSARPRRRARPRRPPSARAGRARGSRRTP